MQKTPFISQNLQTTESRGFQTSSESASKFGLETVEENVEYMTCCCDCLGCKEPLWCAHIRKAAILEID